MNIENLLKAADYIETIPQEKFDMDDFRAAGDFYTVKCKSVGCVVGHCTVLDTEENINIFRTLHREEIDFSDWSDHFFKLENNDHWIWLFSEGWKETDNTPTGAAARIRHYVENGLPKNWQDQINGKVPLTYKP